MAFVVRSHEKDTLFISFRNHDCLIGCACVARRVISMILSIRCRVLLSQTWYAHHSYHSHVVVILDMLSSRAQIDTCTRLTAPDVSELLFLSWQVINVTGFSLAFGLTTGIDTLGGQAFGASS
jgi:hypothetical protein